MAPTFFGLTPDNQQVVYEEIFQLVNFCKLSYTESRRMPVAVRKWWMRRTETLREQEAAAMQAANRKK